MTSSVAKLVTGTLYFWVTCSMTRISRTYSANGSPGCHGAVWIFMWGTPVVCRWSIIHWKGIWSASSGVHFRKTVSERTMACLRALCGNTLDSSQSKIPQIHNELEGAVRGYMRFSLKNGCIFLTKYTSFCNKNDQYQYTFPWYLRSTLTSQRYLLWNALCILSCLRYKVYVDFTLQKHTPKHESTQKIPL